MTVSKVQKLLLASFPPWHRARYGDELQVLTAECGRARRVNLDLARAVLAAWTRPRFTGGREERSRRRLQATTATVFVAWSLSALAVAIYARAVDDQRVPGLRSWAWTAYRAGGVVFEITVAAALVVGFGFWVRVVVPAWQHRDRATVMWSVLPAGIVLLWLAVTAALSYWGRRYGVGHSHHGGPGGWALTGLAVYASFTTVCVVGCAAAAVRALDRAHLHWAELRVAAFLSALATVSLSVVTVAGAVSLIRVLDIGGLDARNDIMAIGPVAFLTAAVLVCATASARGMRQLNHA